ncbi:MAG TPA: hypothetical protein VL361_28960 [Candidatus Limnocylindrales bacterium]|jgi:hypothetical protein|nr:hypothetical protein [Candidatus Limnocylindrales bacterium]
MTFNIAEKAPKEDRVRAQTNPEINRKLDKELEQRLRFYATQDEQTISERIAELDREWDIERVLESSASGLILSTILLSIFRGRKWLVLSLVVSGFLLRHAIEGWCPPVPLLRRLGVRTRLEIEQERYALKVLRGDFDGVAHEEAGKIRNAVDVAQTVRS